MRLKPKKRLGQNFLSDSNILSKMIGACDLNVLDSVLEIGSGKGDLTRLIAKVAGNVLTVEIDWDLIPGLKDAFKDYKNIKLLHRDILKVNLARSFAKSRNKIKVIGNIPYNITTPIIQRLFKYRHKIKTVFLTVQKEFAMRIAAIPGSKQYGSFSCFIQYYSMPKILFTIKSGSFFPSPKVDSCFLRLDIRDEPRIEVKSEKKLFKIIRAAFNQRRKTLKNSLEGVVCLKKIDLFFEKTCLDPNIRPEMLSLDEFAVLANL
jgi:16S rRNA (adenine1518-N6/adenine1519-N6)-dimethyltransferase